MHIFIVKINHEKKNKYEKIVDKKSIYTFSLDIDV